MDDLISRQVAIDALWKALYKYEDETEKQFIESDELDVSDWMLHRIFVQNMSDIDRQTILNLPSAQSEQHERVYKGIVVGYPSNIFLKYEGKPYFSIKYTENGQEFIGYGTYDIEVLSKYLKEYFMPSSQSEQKIGKWIETETSYADGIQECQCSICKRLSPRPLGEFCRWCGATMRG